MRILIADDHVLVRQGLRDTLSYLDDNCLIFEAEDGVHVKEVLSENPEFDLVLLDLYMPRTNGFELINDVCNMYPDMPVVVLSASDHPENMRKSLDRGASGFIPKSTPYDVMLSALHLVLSGGVYIPPGMLHEPPDQPLESDATNSLKDVDLIREKLTRRQIEVLELLGQGDQNKVIAKKLDLSEHTVKIHVTAILKALGVTNRTQAVLSVQSLSANQPAGQENPGSAYMK